MSGWKAKRFWKDVSVARNEGGWHVLLDSRPVRTPAKAAMDLPTEAMALAVAEEWAAQEGDIDALSMPVTRSANSAIDRVAPQHDEVAGMLAAYAETDLLCHRAESPEALAERQAKGWDPLLDWAAEAHGARLLATAGILPVAQPAESLERLALGLRALDPFRLTALHDLVTLSGSLILGLAVAGGRIDVEAGWRLSRIDEDWQIEQWGEDEEAAEAAAYKFEQFRHADRFWRLSAVSS
ncbi:ATP12 family protein [Roseibacterium sp. SDUM158017]|uniref:ATP12 family chaperone protein n=1 Tax=Roseicyclus salinarum TaxID=3036773 RepID=UPI002414EF39|nr:ATP12 family protein [Roseibacterium sp. SDUM158017]MDG4650233.1 ATP12 family protein [Roseibacterium sp. SDUM158017]